MKRFKDTDKFKEGQLIVFLDKSGEGDRKAVQGEVYKLRRVDYQPRAQKLLFAESVKTGTKIGAYVSRFGPYKRPMEENE